MADTPQPPKTKIPESHKLLEIAEGQIARLEAWLKKPEGPGHTVKAESVADANRLLTPLRDLTGTLKELKSGTASGLERAKKLFSKTEIASVEEALKHVSGALHDTIEAAANSRAFEVIHSTVEAAKNKTETATEPLAKESGRISKWITGKLDQHKTWIETKTTGQRLAIGAGYTGLGVILTRFGSTWLSQSVNGFRHKAVTEKDEHGNAIMVGTLQPIPSAERVLKGVLGAGGMIAGIAGTFFGIHHMAVSGHGRDS